MPGKELVPRPAAPLVVTRPPFEPDRNKDAKVPAWRWLWTRRHWTAPAILLPALWLAGLGAHLAHIGGYIIVAGFISIVAVGFFAKSKWDRQPEQIFAVSSVTALFMWLSVAAVFGSGSIKILRWHLPILGVFPDIVLTLFVTVWGVAWWRHKRPRGHRRRQKLIAVWDEWWQSHCWHWNLGGTRVVGVWLMGVTTKVRVQGIPGRHSKQHFDQVMHLLESAADTHPDQDALADVGMIRVETVKGHGALFDLYFKRRNPLAGAVKFDLSLAPASVHEPFAQAMSETGEWAMKSPRRNRFTIGETRSGKSNDLLVAVAQLSGCLDDRQILIDLKGGRSARPLLEAGAVDYVVTDVDEARMLELLLDAEVMARMKYWYTGDEQGHADEDTPAFHLLIDETHDLTATEDGAGDPQCRMLLGKIASKGNGVEVYVWVYTQHGSLETSVGSEQIRGNLPWRTCYRVAEARHGQYCIPEFAKLDASRLEEAGTCYMKDGPQAAAEQVRSPYMPHKLLRQVAAQNARLLGARRPLRLWCGDDPCPAGGTWQQWWDSRWTRLDPAFRDISPQYQQYVAIVGASSPAAASAAALAIQDQARAAAAPVASEPGQGSAAEAAARISGELDECYSSVVPDAVQPRRDLGAAVRTEIERFILALESAPDQGITPTQLMAESGRAKTWVHGHLEELVTRGAVTRIRRGHYRPMPEADLRRAMAQIDAEAARLFAEAKEAVHAG
jgi:hypothetical protein